MEPTARIKPGDPPPPELGHDRYVRNGLSGRIICRVKVETPLVIGASQKTRDPHPTLVRPYQVGGRPAIPASTLRGLVSSIVEAGSNSALRILEPDWPSGGGIKINWPHLNRVPGPRGFFKGLGADLVPLDPGRVKATAAERLFGYVEEDPPANRPARALASRILFSEARLKEDAPFKWGKDVKLRVLASPKPPSPSFYFLKKGDAAIGPDAAFIARGSITPKKHAPRGRKLYFHHEINHGAEPWKSEAPIGDERDKQRLLVKPIPKGTVFYFHIDFNNLLDEELDLLCFGLTPSKAFLHKLGLGKPLGLGSVKIDTVGLLNINRATRYESLTSSRFSVEAARGWTEWPERYSREAAVAAVVNESDADAMRHRASRHGARLSKAYPDIFAALALLGEQQVRESASLLINTPLTTRREHAAGNPASREERTYAWFADMYRTKAQFLPALKTGSLPLVDENSGKPDGR